MHLDVNADGFVSPIDALLIINFINNNGGGIPVNNLPAPPPYRDVDGNNIISANDVLQVINALNADSGGEGEGQSTLFGALQDVSAVQNVPANAELAGAFAAQYAISTGDNGRIGVRQADRNEHAVYGPILPSSGSTEAVFAQISESPLADFSWVEDRDKKEHREIPVDLALTSLLGDLDENGDY
jgi:hypothetical protein